MTDAPTAISLFSGCGGCSLGLLNAGYNLAIAADVDRNACKTYERNLNSPMWQIDLSTVTPLQLAERCGLRSQSIDILVGGPPCQGFTSAGQRDWNDPRNMLISRFVEFVVQLRPTWFIMENVEGLLTFQDGYIFLEAISRFLGAGYWVRAQKVYMHQYGIPQKRKRVLIVGNIENCEFRFPEPHFSDASVDSLFSTLPPLTVMDAISDLPETTESGLFVYNRPKESQYQGRLRGSADGEFTLHKSKPISGEALARIELLKQGNSMKDLPLDLQHPSFARRAFRRVMDGTPTEKRGGAPSGLKRLQASEPSLTITSVASSEFVHPNENRLLSLRECARIQSFPDWFTFHGSTSSIATQLGNAIPPLYMEQIAKHIASQATWRPRLKIKNPRWLGLIASKAEGKSPALNRMLAGLSQRTSEYV